MRTTLLLEISADAIADRIAVGSQANGVSFSRLDNAARSAAIAIAQKGASNVVFVGTNGAVVPVCLFAAGYAGLPFVPLNYRLPDAELKQLLKRSTPAVVIADDDMVSRLEGVDGAEIWKRSEFEAAFLAEPPAGKPAVAEADNDIAVLLFTSGTTGEPKAAVLRHRNLTSYVMSTVEFSSSGEEEAALVSVPPYHIAGISAVLTSAYGGRRIVYLRQFSAEDWVETASAEAITHAMVVPTMLDRILDRMEKTGESLPALRALSYGGGRMPEAVIERAMRILPQVAFVNAYGLTETSSTIALLGPEDHRAAFVSGDPKIRRRLSSVGRPLPSVELEIRDATGKVCGPGEAGEIYVRGEQVSGEYLNRKAMADDGWFATKDAGWLDDDGYLYVDGRLDDVIVRGGENISPGEIEDVLRQCEGVEDVAVLGLPCDRWGEKIAAVIVCRDAEVDTNILSDHVRKQLRSTKTPEAWFFLQELPYNETGKLLRRVLKANICSVS